MRALSQHLALLVKWILLTLLRECSGNAQGLLMLLGGYSGELAEPRVNSA